MCKNIELEEGVNALLNWIQIRKLEINGHLKTMDSNSKYTQRLKGKLSCLNDVEDACNAFGLEGRVMKDFDVTIKLNVIVENEEEVIEQVKDVLHAVSASGLENVISIDEVGISKRKAKELVDKVNHKYKYRRLN